MIKQHFVWTCVSSKVRRTFGGCIYKLDIYENKGKGKVAKVAECSACTSAHKGEDSEVYSALLAAGAIRPAVKKQLADGRGEYYGYDMREKGLTIQALGSI
jgi:hypothetical protein